MASLASVFKDPGSDKKDGLLSLDTTMVPLPPRWSCVITNVNKRFLVVVGLGGLFDIRNQIVDAVVIARILEASLVFLVSNRDERFNDIREETRNWTCGKEFVCIQKLIPGVWMTHLLLEEAKGQIRYPSDNLLKIIRIDEITAKRNRLAVERAAREAHELALADAYRGAALKRINE
nr:O-fucosyltransferase 37 [Tanacetum cinerariifolium]